MDFNKKLIDLLNNFSNLNKLPLALIKISDAFIISYKGNHNELFTLAQKLGITYIQYNGQKKTPSEIMQGIRNKKG